MRQVRRPYLCIAGALTLLAGLTQSCAAQTPAPIALGDAASGDIAWGHDLAAASCASCHAIGPVGASPNRRAPPFHSLKGKYVELTLHRRLTETAETGHYDMPAAPVHSDQIRALVAYINSLGPADTIVPRR